MQLLIDFPMRMRKVLGMAVISVLALPFSAEAVTFEEKELDAVVQVISYNDGEEYYYAGTGFLVGYTTPCVMTATHIIIDENESFRDTLLVAFNAGTEEEELFYAYPLIAYTDADTAIVCIEDEMFVERFRYFFPWMSQESLDAIDVGEDLSVLGYPSVGGSTLTTTFGRLSGFDILVEDRDVLKMDAEVSPGVSGGPVLNDDKELVGMALAYSVSEAGDGIGYAASVQFLNTVGDAMMEHFVELAAAAGLEIIPEDCVKNSDTGYYTSGGKNYYSYGCETEVNRKKEQIVESQYEHWCSEEIHESALLSAVTTLTDDSQELGNEDWLTFLDEFCGSVAEFDPYRFYTPEQDLQAELVKSPEDSAVYAVLDDGKRHAFPNEAVYRSWYGDDGFATVKTIPAEVLASYALGKNITFHPGTLVKMPTVPQVYMVSDDNELRWLTDETTAQTIYGDAWAQQVYDLSEVFFLNYATGGEELTITP